MSERRTKNEVSAIDRARALFGRHKGVLHTREAMRAGIHPRTLYAMRDARVIENISRGVFRLSDLPALANPDLSVVGVRVPRGVVCLVSALAFHGLTTQIPHEVWIALPRGTEPPRLDFPPLRLIWTMGSAYSEGIEEHDVDGITVRVYSVEKTLADCFKYRNKIGLDTVIEALKLYRNHKKLDVEALMQFARVCRVEKAMRPYLDALL